MNIRAARRTTVGILVLLRSAGIAPVAHAADISLPWVPPEVAAPHLQRCVFDSATVGAKAGFHVYTPAVYDAEATRRFPVLYWLHGTGGGQAGLPRLAAHFDAAIRTGRIPPMLVVFPNGLDAGMWCDSKDGRMPVETLVVKDLVAHIDATFRTVASREGRIVEGFSMGGYGAARLAFKHPDLFGAVSILGAGPLDLEFKGPRATAKPGERERIFQTVWGGDVEYYRAQSPWVMAERNRARLQEHVRIRQVVGDRDPTLADNRNLDAHLTQLGIRHDFIALPGVGHNPLAVFEAFGDANWEFYRAVLGPGTTDTDQPPMATVVDHDRSPAPARDQREASFDEDAIHLEPGRRVFFAFGKAMLKDDVPHQQRAWDAVQYVKERLEPLGLAGQVLQEDVRSYDDYTGNPTPFVVTRSRVLDELDSLQRNLGSNDTLIIYSHSHGMQGRSGKPGGLPLDDPGTGRWRPFHLDWREYADHLLRLPARTVVVLTMACHSGGLVEFLNSDDGARRRWQTRKEQGRNFLVLTSQNGHSLSNPRRIDGRLINPFTHAVLKAFDGAADGYERGRKERHPDGRITLGELADFVPDEARRHTAPGDGKNDPDPQMTGSFDRETLLATLSAAGAKPPTGLSLNPETP